MRNFMLLLLAMLTAAALPAQDGGVMPRWEIVDLAEDIVQHTENVKKILRDVRPKEWIQDGAPEHYVEQHETILAELEHLSGSAADLNRNPDNLRRVIETFLWLDRMRSMIGSMAYGVRTYYNGAIADLLDSAQNRNAGAEEKLKAYMRDLAVLTEQEMEIAHDEAQRCRGTLAKQPRGD